MTVALSSSPVRRGTVSWLVITVWLLASTAVLEWPMSRGGYLLGHDMVFTPHQPLDAASFGISTAAPRAVPLDALAAMAEHVVNGAVVGRIAVVFPVLAAGFGCAVLLMDAATAGRLAAATAATWTPFVIERLAIGQWALLWGYAALPWLVVGVRAGRGRRAWALCPLALAAAAITPTGALLAGATAVIVVLVVPAPRRDVVITLALAIVVQLPWLVPAVTSTSAGTSDPRAVAVFAPRAEHAGGTLLSLLGGGGIWDADVVPASRGGAHGFVWLALLAFGAAFGVRQLAGRMGRRTMAALAIPAGLGLLLAALPVLPGGAALLRAVVDAVPGAGLLRDSQKWLAPFVLLEALVLGAAVDRVAGVLRDRAAVWSVVLVLAAAAVPVAVLPDAAATLRVPWRPVHYPADWATVARLLEQRPGDVAVLPLSAYRSFEWAPGRTVLDPAPRLLPRPTVVDDRLAVGDAVLHGENRRVVQVAAAVRAGPGLAHGLADAGIQWVVVEHRTPGTLPSLSALTQAYAGDDVSLYRVPGTVRAPAVGAATTTAVLAGDIVAAMAVAGAMFGALLPTRRRRRVREAEA